MSVNRTPETSLDPRLYLRREELDQAVAACLSASRALFRTASPALRSEHLGPSHFRALSMMRQQPGLTVTALRTALMIAKPSLARVLRDLTEAGFISRVTDVRDRRARRLSLTPLGLDAEAKAANALREHMARAFQAVGPDAAIGALKIWQALQSDHPEDL